MLNTKKIHNKVDFLIFYANTGCFLIIIETKSTSQRASQPSKIHKTPINTRP